MNQSATRADILNRAQKMRKPTPRQIEREFNRIQDPSIQPPWMQDPDDVYEDDIFTVMDFDE